MGGAGETGRGGGNDDEIVELGEVVVDEKDEERRANPGVNREEEEGGGGGGVGRGRGMTPAASCTLRNGCATDLAHPWQQKPPIFHRQGRW